MIASWMRASILWLLVLLRRGLAQTHAFAEEGEATWMILVRLRGKELRGIVHREIVPLVPIPGH